MKKNKIIVALYGDAEHKNLFNETIKNAGFWVWNANPRNFLSVLARKHLGWNGKRTNEFYEFLEQFKDLVDKYWDYDLNYVKEMIYKLWNDKKTNVLILHNVGLTTINELSEEEVANLITVYLGDYLPDEHGKQIDMSDPDWENLILRLFDEIEIN